MKKLILGLALLAFESSTASADPVLVCKQHTALVYTLAYVEAQYGATNVDTWQYGFGIWQGVWVPPAQYAGQTFALVTFPTPQPSSYCTSRANWYNCTSGTCVLTAYVTCSGFVGKNWMEQCSQKPAKN